MILCIKEAQYCNLYMKYMPQACEPTADTSYRVVKDHERLTLKPSTVPLNCTS
jgi:hypothetical protein